MPQQPSTFNVHAHTLASHIYVHWVHARSFDFPSTHTRLNCTTDSHLLIHPPTHVPPYTTTHTHTHTITTTTYRESHTQTHAHTHTHRSTHTRRAHTHPHTHTHTHTHNSHNNRVLCQTNTVSYCVWLTTDNVLSNTGTR